MFGLSFCNCVSCKHECDGQLIQLFLLGALLENVYGRIGNKIIKYLLASHSQPIFLTTVIVSKFLKLQMNFVEVF